MDNELNHSTRMFKAVTPGAAWWPRHGDDLLLAKSRIPSNGELVQIVRACLRRGERKIVLDLAAVSTIDAAGIGELVRAYSVASAGNGVLRIVNANAWVRETLERVGLFNRFVSPDAIGAYVDAALHAATGNIRRCSGNSHGRRC
jgi:anti-anti-sigma factor